jgi:hypothetical protein
VGVDRAELRIVAAWRATRRLSLALEANPGADELLPNFNFAPSLPGEHLAGVGAVLGTSSDRIGTPDGRSWFGTLTLSPAAWGVGLPLTAYAGAAYGTWRNDLRAIGGLTWSIGERWSLGVQHDGRSLHGVAGYQLGDLGPGGAWWSVELLAVEVQDERSLGLNLSARF